MKRFNYIIGLLTLLAIYGCKKDWEAPGAEPNHQVIYTSEYQFGNQVQVGGSITFTDASKGIVNRTWTLPEGAVIEGTTDQTSSSADLIHIQFDEAGEKEVLLSQEFAGAAYVNSVQKSANLDTAIVITVLDSVALSLKAHYYFADGSTGDELDLSQVNEVQAGRMVKYTITPIGSPTRLAFTFDGGDPESVIYDEQQIIAGEATETIVQYKKLGDYSVSVTGSRSRPEGSDALLFENAIRVITSNDPVELTNVYTEGDLIALDFSREIDAKSLDVSTFNVHIKNNALDSDVAIARAYLDPNSLNKVLLELSSEKVYYNDTAKVSYTPGVLQSTDGKAVDQFTDQLISIGGLVNILEASTFDQGIENSFDTNFIPAGWGGAFDNYTSEVTSEKAYSGANSLKIHMADENASMAMLHVDGSGAGHEVPTVAGKTYLITAMLYLDNYAGWAGFEVDFNGTWTNRVELDANPDKQNVWMEVSFGYYTCSGNDSKVPTLRAFNSYGGGAPLTYYVDDFSVIEVELRP
ncbi:hypothetical protein MY04_5517 [Flammeovirga sp. MY04]|uniref:hypothetical protein n=1 Tax=Flammeovirga sp. MY04 TaxID=1191459 RepID=UPI0008063ECE|nr:hypothetical protein [Flammeovirga sp. MY04]ANQ52848.1 hypothetical protein MY04_5517 [Flammeovirga sp. MY04]